MQIILFIYLGISIINLLLAYLIGYSAAKEYKRKYPNFKATKKSFVEQISTHIRLFLLCFVPIINIIMMFTFIFKWDNQINYVIEELEKKES